MRSGVGLGQLSGRSVCRRARCVSQLFQYGRVPACRPAPLQDSSQSVTMPPLLPVALLLLYATRSGALHRQWKSSVDLEGLRLSWTPKTEKIVFQVEASTLGYVGVGFSRDGSMVDADVVIGWVDDNSQKAFLLLETFSMALLERKANFSAAGFFVMDLKLVSRMASFMAPIILFLVQNNNQPHSKRHQSS